SPSGGGGLGLPAGPGHRGRAGARGDPPARHPGRLRHGARAPRQHRARRAAPQPDHRDRHAEGPRARHRRGARPASHGPTGAGGRHPGPPRGGPAVIAASRWTRVRIALCGATFVGLFLAVGKRAYHLQVGDADRLRAMAEEQYLREIELPPRRGRILDRNGADLASTADVDSIYCNPRQLPDPKDAARRLSLVLGMDRADLEKKLSQRRFFAWIKRKVTPEEAAAVRAMKLPGLAMTREPRRFYPNRTLAATVMGRAGSDGGGLDGVELALDKALRGTTSSVQGIRDALGREIAVDGVDAPSTAGSDVVLTLDRYLTFITERALAAGAAEHHAKGAISIMMDPHTGEVLAMASVPTFN